MRTGTKAWTAIVMAGLALEGWALHVLSASPARWRPAMIVRDDPVAHTLYEVMVRTLQEANSLSYTSVCSGPDERTSTYRVWLAKPNALRVEVSNGPRESGTLVCDGNDLWIYWEGDRPFLRVDDPNTYEKTRSNVYVRRSAKAGEVSIANEMALLGIAWYGIILDPSLFHGHADPLESSVDGVRARGQDRIGDQECDVIEVSYDRAHRTRYFWVSRHDNLPRKVKEVVRPTEASVTVTVEEWSEVVINPEIPQRTFIWSPPEGWRQWNPPPSGSVRLP